MDSMAMTATEIRNLAAKNLPHRYEPLNLIFFGSESRLADEYVFIGREDYGPDICVNVANGEVFSIDPEGRLPSRLINSSIKELGRCIEVADKYPRKAGEGPEVTADYLREEITRIDARALENEENWWSVILEQLSAGL